MVPRYYRPFAEKWVKDRRRNPYNQQRRKIKRRYDQIIRKPKEVIEDWHRLTWSNLLIILDERIHHLRWEKGQCSLLQLAKNLVPEVKPREWKEIFRWFEIDYSEIIQFPLSDVGIVTPGEFVQSYREEMSERGKVDRLLPFSSLVASTSRNIPPLIP
jgi:hypothetical protein